MAKRQTELEKAITKIEDDIVDLQREITILEHARSRLIQQQAARPVRRQKFVAEADEAKSA